MEINGWKLKNLINDVKSKLADYNDDHSIENSRKLWEALRKVDREADVLEKIALNFREKMQRAQAKLQALQRTIETSEI